LQNLWLLNLVTKEFKQLTFGIFDQRSDCTPDGKYVVFESFDVKSGVRVISSLPIEGGPPKELARGQVFYPRVSPDGKYIAYMRGEGQGSKAETRFVVQNLADGSSKDIPEVGAEDIRWTPDGRGLAFLKTETNGSSLYLQPLPGGKVIRLMHFDEEP